MHAEIDWKSKVHFTAVADSQHEISIDGPPDLGGENMGTRPMELMLLGLGGCAATDVVHILKKSRQDVTECKVLIDAERAETEPKVFTRIHLTFQIRGNDLEPKKAQRAVALSAEKYCSASILLRRAGVDVSHDLQIKSKRAR